MRPIIARPVRSRSTLMTRHTDDVMGFQQKDPSGHQRLGRQDAATWIERGPKLAGQEGAARVQRKEYYRGDTTAGRSTVLQIQFVDASFATTSPQRFSHPDERSTQRYCPPQWPSVRLFGSLGVQRIATPLQ